MAYLEDAWISNRLRLALLTDSQVSSVNYNVETVDKVVHLTGLARSRDELCKVIDHAATTPGVVRVVSHVLTIDDPRRQVCPSRSARGELSRCPEDRHADRRHPDGPDRVRRHPCRQHLPAGARGAGARAPAVLLPGAGPRLARRAAAGGGPRPGGAAGRGRPRRAGRAARAGSGRGGRRPAAPGPALRHDLHHQHAPAGDDPPEDAGGERPVLGAELAREGDGAASSAT